MTDRWNRAPRLSGDDVARRRRVGGDTVSDEVTGVGPGDEPLPAVASDSARIEATLPVADSATRARVMHHLQGLVGNRYARGVAQRLLQRDPAPSSASPVGPSHANGPDRFRVPLINGDLKDKGEFVDLGYYVVLLDSLLDDALKYYTAKWSISLFEPIGDEPKAEPQKAPYGGGHSAGGKVKGFPTWYTGFQDRLIGSTTWGADEKAVEALLEAYLRARTPGVPAAVKQFYHQIGKSKTNKQSFAKDYLPGSDTYNWCAAASTNAVVRALNDAGYYFKPVYANQDGLYLDWLNGKAFHAERQIDPPSAHTASLSPGDKLTILTSASPKSGHVVTVIGEVSLPHVKGDDPVSTLTMISGNAGGGGGSVRVEEVTRRVPPKGYVWNVT